MKEITYFYLTGCPYCREADRFLKELIAENPKYAEIKIKKVEETVEKEYADSFDYYYVPCFYIDGKKVLEGEVKKEDVKRALNLALE